MKILIIDNYPEKFLKQHYERFNYEALTYNEIQQKLFEALFSTSDFLSSAFKKYGIEAKEVIANDRISQFKWYCENHSKKISAIKPVSYYQKLAKKVNIFKLIPEYKILENQIQIFKPDIIYIQEGNILSDSFIGHLRKYGKLVGQIASEIPKNRSYKNYDLILSAFPYYVQLFNNFGKKCFFQKLAFSPEVLSKISAPTQYIPLSFIGTYSPTIYQAGTVNLEYLAHRNQIKFWGTGYDCLLENSVFKKNWQGYAWGVEVYKILAMSQISLNRHGEIAKKYASNLRLYEATGVGSCLLTDWKENLNDIFIIDKEIVAYRNKEELVEKVNYLLMHDNERKAIAAAGQKRTLADHTYENRVSELVNIFKKYLL